MCNTNENPFLAFHQRAQAKALLFEHFPNAYHHDVFDCEEAARARGVPLEHELKHLLLETGKGFCLAHVAGDLKLSLRKVKRHLRVREASLADLATFPHARLQRGSVCPFVEPLWSLQHLVDHSILNIPSMTTNDGTHRGYLRFDPKILFLARLNEVGDFAA